MDQCRKGRINGRNLKMMTTGSKREVCVCDYVCVTCFLLSIKLKCFSNFMVCVCVNQNQLLLLYSMSSSSSLSFLGVYKRGLRGGSRFVWCPATLGIIIRGFFQFHRSGPRLPLFRIAPHLRSLIRERVGTVGTLGSPHFFRSILLDFSLTPSSLQPGK